MLNNKLSYLPLSSIGLCQSTVPPNVFNTLKQEVDELYDTNFANGKPHNYILAGHIEHEYLIEKSIPVLETYIQSIMPSYVELMRLNQVQQLPTRGTYFLPNYGDKSSVWVNFQQKYEYNPIHIHNDCLVSFVIYLNIPYNLEEESRLRSSRSGTAPVLPNITFIYPHSQTSGSVSFRSFELSSNDVGTIFLFPSSLAHYVTPFYTTDEYRITVAGNINFRNDNS